jgi:hypothetical protein
MAKEKAKLEVRTATTFADIFGDKNKNRFYEIFLKLAKGNSIKRYLAKGIVNHYGANRFICKCYSKTGQAIFTWFGGDTKSFVVNLDGEKGLEITSAKVQCDYRLYTAYVSREEAYNAAMHGLKMQKLKINKQIINLQNELYGDRRISEESGDSSNGQEL